MQALASLIMRGTASAAGIAGLFGLAGLFLPPAWLVSGAAVSLYTLRRGPGPGLQVLALATLICGAVAEIALGFGAQVLLLGLVIWLPMWLAAQVLRRSSDQGIALSAIGGVAALYVMGTYLIVPDPAVWWTRQLEIFRAALVEQGSGALLENANLVELGSRMTAAVGLYIVYSMMLMLLLSRWWQSQLYNVGAFRKEFHVLALPNRLRYGVLALALVVLIASYAGPGQPVFQDLLRIAILMYAVQGLAVVHFHATERAVAGVWLVPVYILFLFISPVLALVGYADSFLDTRRLHGQAKV